MESMQVTAQVNQSTYIEVYGWSGATNVYDIEITTDNPGGGQAFESVDVSIINTTHATLDFWLDQRHDIQLQLQLRATPS